MRKLMISLVALGLVGCSSMADLRAGKPDAEFTSKKRSESVAECILFGWQKNSVRYGDVYMQPFENGKTVFTQISVEVADIVESNSITNVKFYYQGGLFAYRVNSRIDVIKQCI